MRFTNTLAAGRVAGTLALIVGMSYAFAAVGAESKDNGEAPSGRINFEAAKLPPASIEVDLSQEMFKDLFGIGDAAIAGVAETLLKYAQRDGDAKNVALAAEQLEAAKQITQLAGNVVREVRVRVYQGLPEGFDDAYQQAVAKLAAVRATRQVLDQRDGRTRQLLAVDVTGRTARVAVAVGDVDRAAHVAVVVPGFTTTVERDLTGADRVSADLADQSRRAATLVGDHRDSVVLRASAEAGAGGLATFLRGLPSDQHVTLVGHSYGSTTAGLAVARGDTGVDDLVVLGSPGLGADTSTELGLPPRHVHVLEADEDPVADLGWFGRDPSGLPGVDRLSTDDVELPDGRTGRRSVGHSGYLVPGTTSQWNVAAVVAGAPVVREGRPPPSW